MAAGGARHGRSAFAFVFVTLLLDMLALGVIVPVLPNLVVGMRGGDASTGAAWVGVFGAVFAGMQFLCSPVLGALSDHVGRRRVILLSCAGLGLDYVLMAVAPNLWWLLAGRVISGITASTWGTVSAYVADVVPPEERAAKSGMLGVAFGLGFILGPGAGGLLGVLSVRAPFWGAAALSLANAAYGYFVLPESLPVERRSPFYWAHASPIGAFRMLRADRRLFALACAGFLSMLAHDAAPSTFVLYTTWRYGWTAWMIGLALGLVGVTSMIVQAGLVGRTVSALGERGALAAGLVSGLVANAAFGLASSGAWFLAAVPLSAFYGVSSPALQGMMTRLVGPDEQGRLQGAQGSLMGIASMAGPLMFTQAFAAAVGPLSSWHVPGAPFLLAAVLLALALIVVLTAPDGKAPAHSG